ncbi:MAG TPA: hypothetical protein VM598_07500 [Bdellovibrionota bacterium]|nr:hypothetical protein [Bdellovibrionota bacterium]
MRPAFLITCILFAGLASGSTAWAVCGHERLLNLVRRAIQATDEGARLKSIYARSVESFVAEGREKFPEGLAGLPLSVRGEPQRGLIYPVRSAVQGDRELIVKSGVPMREIQTARAMQELGLGPEVDLVREVQGLPKPVYHLVMRRAEGVNSKVFIWVADYLNHPVPLKDPDFAAMITPSYIATMRNEIEGILGKRFTSDRDAFQAYARAILEDAALMARLHEVGDILSSHFTQLPDFQLMIRPSVGEAGYSAQVIDAGLAARKDTLRQVLATERRAWQLRRGVTPSRMTAEDIGRLGRRASPEPTPSAEVEAFIERLRRVAAGIPVHGN